MSGKATTLGAFVWTWLALLLLAALSFALSYLSLGAWEMPLAMIIAGAKALLVLLVFMELLTTGFLPRVIVVVMIAWLTLLMSFMVLDVLTRWNAGVRAPLPDLPAGTEAPF